jgi:hypothetical protein
VTVTEHAHLLLLAVGDLQGCHTSNMLKP